MHAKINDISQEKFNAHVYSVDKRVANLQKDRSVTFFIILNVRPKDRSPQRNSKFFINTIANPTKKRKMS